MVPPKNPNKHLLSDDETYVDWVVEHIFKTQDGVNVFQSFKGYVNDIDKKIMNRIFNPNASWNSTYLYNIVAGKTTYSVVYDDIKKHGSMGTLKRLDFLLPCTPANVKLIHTQTGLPESIISASTHILVEVRVVVFSWIPSFSVFFHGSRALIAAVKMVVSTGSAVLTFGANADSLISSIRDFASSGDQLGRVIYRNAKSYGAIKDIFSNGYAAKIAYNERGEALASLETAKSDIGSNNPPETDLMNGVINLNNTNTPIQKINRSMFNPMRLRAAQRDETETENRHRNQEATAIQKKLEFALQFIVVQQITPVKLTSVFKYNDFKNNKEYSTTTTEIYSSAAVRVGQITSQTYSTMVDQGSTILEKEESIKRVLRPWEAFHSANFVHDVINGETVDVKGFDTLPGQWILKDSCESNKKINANVMDAHKAKLQKSALLKIKFQHLVREYNKQQSIKSVAEDVNTAKLARNIEKYKVERATFLNRSSFFTARLKYDIFLKATESWTFGVVKNARTNTNLTFIDGELKAFETKIKDGNLHPNLPEAYFLWNSEIEHILSLIILGCNKYFELKHVGEGVDQTAFTGRKSAVKDVRDQALECQKIALEHLTFLDKSVI
jgi:hypothetical protein